MNHTDPRCAVESFDDAQVQSLRVFTILTALLSVAGSGFIVLTYFLPQPQKSISLKIIMSLSVADLCASLVFVIDGSADAADMDHCGGPESALCTLCAAAAQFFGLATILWTGMIAVSLHLSVLRRSPLATHDPAKLYRFMSYGVWGASAFALLIAGSAGALGPSGQWCWIRQQHWWAGLVFYYLPLIFVGVYSAVVYVKTLSGLVQLHREATANAAQLGQKMSQAAGAVPGLTARLRSFLIVYCTIHAAQIANRMQDLLSPYNPVFVLYLLQSLLSPMQGVGNAIAYGWSPRVRRLWAAAYPKSCACALATDERADSESSGPARPGVTEVMPTGGLREDSLNVEVADMR